jgi:hypothetical protein
VKSFPTVQSHELASCFNWEAPRLFGKRGPVQTATVPPLAKASMQNGLTTQSHDDDAAFARHDAA